MNPKSARQARGGISLFMRMFACYTSAMDHTNNAGNTNAFEVAISEICIMNIPETLGHTVQL